MDDGERLEVGSRGFLAEVMVGPLAETENDGVSARAAAPAMAEDEGLRPRRSVGVAFSGWNESALRTEGMASSVDVGPRTCDAVKDDPPSVSLLEYWRSLLVAAVRERGRTSKMGEMSFGDVGIVRTGASAKADSVASRSLSSASSSAC